MDTDSSADTGSADTGSADTGSADTGSLVTYEHDAGVATIAMDDGKANVMSPAMQAELHAALDRAEADRAAIVLSGRDGMFSAGFDLGVLAGGGGEAIDMVIGGFRLMRRVFSFQRPVVVACTGHAVAMGAFLLATGDHRVARSTPTKFQANEVAIGMTMPYSVTAMLRSRLNPAVADRAVLLSHSFGPEGAVAAGFVDEIVAPEVVTTHALEVAGRLAQLPKGAFAGTKQRWRGPTLLAIDEAIERDRADLERRLTSSSPTTD